MPTPVVSAPFPVAGRRILLLADGRFSSANGKTAVCVARYLPRDVVAVVDASRAGRSVRDAVGAPCDAPVVGSVEEALPARPQVAILGVAPTGGGLDGSDRAAVARCLDAGIDVVSGMHAFIADDEELRARARASGSRVWDVRRVPEVRLVSTGAGCGTGAHVVLTVGSDCGTGKMTVALELDRAAREAGLRSSWAATGQTGMIIRGRGVPVDRVIADFIGGAVEALVNLEGEGREVLFVEGQGALMHPSYAPVMLGLLYGSMPDAMVLVHAADRMHYRRFGVRIPPLREVIAAYERMMSPYKSSRVVAVALNTSALAEREARAAVERIEKEAGLPAADVVRSGAGVILDALRARMNDNERGEA